jgi:Fe-S-cluster-containing dehydrogenase component
VRGGWSGTQRFGLTSPEFPDGADTPPDGFSRRTMLGLMGASFGLAGLAGCRRPEEAIVPYVNAPPEVTPGVASSYATTMPLGTQAFGVVVESHEGRPTKIEGNELHPSSLGAASSWMQAATLDLYDPDRGRRPTRHGGAGEGGAEGEQETSWEDVAAYFDTLAEGGSGGEDVAILSEAFSSPTLARLARQVRQRFPRARFVVWDPAGDGNAFEGIRQATGSAGRPVADFSRAEVILTLDADPLLTEGEALANARGFARRRKPDPNESPSRTDVERRMNRLYAVESTMSVTGANADHRVRVPSSKIGAFAERVARRVGAGGGAGEVRGELPEEAAATATVIADDLRRAGSRALVVAGRRQPPEVHALVHRINQALGAVGTTVTLGGLGDVGWGRTGELYSLTREMVGGSVRTLVILGGNPAYDAPDGIPFAAAMGRVETVMHLAPRPNETSTRSGARAGWYLPQSHFLESWGDARAADGTASVIQPLIAPLFDSRSAAEVLAMIAGAESTDGYSLVRETWGVTSEDSVAPGSAWQRLLHDGVARDGAGPSPVRLPPPPSAEERPRRDTAAGEDTLELTFLVSPSVHDGRFANNAWLQEEPDPITRVTWTNVAMLSPATAEALGVEDGDLLRLTVADGDEGDDAASVEAPAFVAPGQADGTAALELGYGAAGGRVAKGRGVNAYPLRGVQSGWWRTVRVAPTGGRADLAQTQEHWDMEGRHLVREASLVRFREEPDFAGHVHGPELESLWKEPNVESGYQWGMTVDLSTCIGCNACVTACQSENNIPVVGPEQVAKGREMLWLRVDRYFEGGAAHPHAVFQPVPCMHCENAPCEQVCPVAATVHDDEGLNAMVYNRCIGTRYCSNNCPYKVRRFNFFNYTKDTPELVQLGMNPDVTVRSRGVMEKCTYCVQRIDEAKRTAKLEDRPVRDGEIQTACQQTCPAEAITFGNINDAESAVSKAKRDPRGYALLAELNNQPRTTYLAKIRNPNPEWPETAAAAHEGAHT